MIMVKKGSVPIFANFEPICLCSFGEYFWLKYSQALDTALQDFLRRNSVFYFLVVRRPSKLPLQGFATGLCEKSMSADADVHSQQSVTSGWVRVWQRHLLLLRKSRRCSWPRLRSGKLQLRTDRWRTAQKLFVWSFVCRLSGCFSSLFEVIKGLGLHSEGSNLTFFCERKSDVVSGRGDQWYMSAAVGGRSCAGAESEFEKGKVGWGRCVQIKINTKNYWK